MKLPANALVDSPKKVALAAGAAMLLIALVAAVFVFGGRGAGSQPEEPVYPLEFPTDVFRSPEPLPEMFQDIEVPDPADDGAAPPGRPDGQVSPLPPPP